MSDELPVVWREGMFLRPQHFQQTDRFMRASIRDSVRSLTPYAWGVREMRINLNLAEAGEFSLDQCAGVFPDGTPFSIPNLNLAPKSLRCSRDAIDNVIYLAMPASATMQRTRQREVVAPGSAEAASDGIDLEVGDLDLSFVEQRSDRSGLLCLPLAKIKEVRPDKGLIFDHRHIPALMRCDASPRLQGYLKELCSIIAGQTERLAGRYANARAEAPDAVRDLFELAALNRYSLLLEHFSKLADLHPELFYRTLIGMLGELATFSRDRRPSLQPNYVHDDLQLSFDPLEAALSALLARIREAKAVSLTVEYRKEYGIWVSQVPDQALLEKGIFIMSVRAAMSAEDLVSRYRNQTKVGSALGIGDLISGAKKGIGLKHLPVPPSDLPHKAGWQYFEIDTTSDLWRNVLDLRNQRGIAFHMDHPLPEMQQELWAIRTGQD